MVIGRSTLLKYLVGLVLFVGLCILVDQVLYLSPTDPNGSTFHSTQAQLQGQRTMTEDGGYPGSHPKVLIVSMPRSGSTFMLEIFNNHPDYLPLFETTKWMRRHPHVCDMNTFKKNTIKSIEAQWFEDMYMCDFHDYKPRLGKWGETKSGDKSQCTKGDPPNKIVVLKEIWPWGIRLDWLNQIIGEDLKVISLTRDVRGFVSSYLFIPVYNITVTPTFAFGVQPDPNDPLQRPYNFTKTKRPLYQTWRMDRVDLWTHFCLEGIEVPKFMRARMPFIKRVMQDKYAAPHLRMAAVWTVMTAATQYNLHTYLQGRYLNVSHTELSLNPHKVVDEMFSFLGNRAIPSVHNFMDSHTREGNYTTRHSTSRNSTEAAVIFLSRLSEKQLIDIEAIAAGVMEPLGFAPLFKKKIKLDAENYERVPAGIGIPRPNMPIFAWREEEKEEEKVEEKEDKGGQESMKVEEEEKGKEGEGEGKGEKDGEDDDESEMEEVTEEEAKAAEVGEKLGIWTELEGEIKALIQEEVRKHLADGVSIEFPKDIWEAIKKDRDAAIEVRIKEVKEQVIAEIKAEYELVPKRT